MRPRDKRMMPVFFISAFMGLDGPFFAFVAAAGGAIHEAKRSTPTGCYAGHTGSIVQLLVLGEKQREQ